MDILKEVCQTVVEDYSSTTSLQENQLDTGLSYFDEKYIY